MSLLLAHHSPWLDVLKRAEASKESIDVLREVIVLQKEIEALPPSSGKTLQEEVDSLPRSDKEEQMTSESFITPPKPTELTTLRSMTLVNGSIQYIDEGYWDGYDELAQERQELDREFLRESALIDLEKYYKLAAVKRVDVLSVDVKDADIQFNIESEINVHATQYAEGMDKAFKRHMREVLNGSDGHDAAIVLQGQLWGIFGGWTKTVLRLKYQAIGFDPDVWCK